MPEIKIDRQTSIYIRKAKGALYPSPELYPAPDLFPNKGLLVINDISKVRIEEGSLSLEKMLFDRELRFGSACASKFECGLYNISQEIVGCDIQVVMRENGAKKYIFTGVIDSAEKDYFGDSRKLVAYDKLYSLRETNVAEWWNHYWEDRETSTLKHIRESLIAYIGLETSELDISYANDAAVIYRYDEYSTIPFGDVLGMITELQGTFPSISADGKLEFVSLGSSIADIMNTFDGNGNFEKANSSYEDYRTSKITGIAVYTSDDDMTQAVGRSGNMYPIAGNVFLLGMTADGINQVCERLLDKIKDYSYVPCNIPLIVSDVDINLGAEVMTEHGSTYVTRIEMSGGRFIEEKLIAEAQGEKLDETASNYNNWIIEAHRYTKITQDIERIRLEAGSKVGQQEFNSYVEQTSKSIESRVSKIEYGKDQEEISSTIKQLPHSIELTVESSSGKNTGIKVSINDEDGNEVDSASGTIVLSGDVVVKDNLTDGQTIISGDNIKTGTVSLGGYNNQDGLLVIKNAENQDHGIWDCEKLSIGDYFLINENGILFKDKNIEPDHFLKPGKKLIIDSPRIPDANGNPHNSFIRIYITMEYPYRYLITNVHVRAAYNASSGSASTVTEPTFTLQINSQPIEYDSQLNADVYYFEISIYELQSKLPYIQGFNSGSIINIYDIEISVSDGEPEICKVEIYKDLNNGEYEVYETVASRSSRGASAARLSLIDHVIGFNNIDILDDELKAYEGYEINGISFENDTEEKIYSLSQDGFMHKRIYQNATSTSGAKALYINSSGNIIASSSSKRYKENINYNVSLDDVKSLYGLKVARFNYKNEYGGGPEEIGLIAEDVAEYYPQAAVRNNDGNIESWGERQMIPALLLLIQEQNKRINKLEKMMRRMKDVTELE